MVTKDVLIELPTNHLILFCNLNCEKIFPSFSLFSREEPWGNPQVYGDIIKMTYDYLLQNTNKINLEEMENNILDNFPDLDDFTSGLASYAFDASCAFDELRLLLVTSNNVHAYNNSQACINTVDMFVQGKENLDPRDKLLEEKIDNHPYMKKEVQRQTTIINELISIPEINQNAINYLRKINDDFGDMLDLKDLYNLS